MYGEGQPSLQGIAGILLRKRTAAWRASVTHPHSGTIKVGPRFYSLGHKVLMPHGDNEKESPEEAR